MNTSNPTDILKHRGVLRIVETKKRIKVYLEYKNKTVGLSSKKTDNTLDHLLAELEKLTRETL